MDLFNQDLMYEFQAKEMVQTESLKQFANHAVREIVAAAGRDADVQVHVEPEVKDKRLFSVSIGVFGVGDPIVVRKEGKHVLGVLRRVRKAVLRKIHNATKRKISFRRKAG